MNEVKKDASIASTPPQEKVKGPPTINFNKIENMFKKLNESEKNQALNQQPNESKSV